MFNTNTNIVILKFIKWVEKIHAIKLGIPSRHLAQYGSLITSGISKEQQRQFISSCYTIQKNGIENRLQSTYNLSGRVPPKQCFFGY